MILRNFLRNTRLTMKSRTMINPNLRKYFSGETEEVNYYEELGLKKSATKKEIKTKYKTLVKKYHPDVYKGKDSKRFQKIQEAYSTLVSPRKRAAYDEELLNKQRPNDYRRGENEENVDWSDIDEEYKSSKSADDFYKDFSKVGKNSQEAADLREEYQKFRKQKTYTKFGDIDVRENQLIRNLNEKDRKRKDFIARKNMTKNERLFTTKEEDVTFDNVVDDTVHLMNENSSKKRTERNQREGEKMGWIGGLMKLGALIGVAGLLGSLVFMMNIKIDTEERKQKMERVTTESFIHYMREDLKNRMVFDQEED